MLIHFRNTRSDQTKDEKLTKSKMSYRTRKGKNFDQKYEIKLRSLCLIILHY